MRLQSACVNATPLTQEANNRTVVEGYSTCLDLMCEEVVRQIKSFLPDAKMHEIAEPTNEAYGLADLDPNDSEWNAGDYWHWHETIESTSLEHVMEVATYHTQKLKHVKDVKTLYIRGVDAGVCKDFASKEIRLQMLIRFSLGFDDNDKH